MPGLSAAYGNAGSNLSITNIPSPSTCEVQVLSAHFQHIPLFCTELFSVWQGFEQAART